jgi:hypothetical protein
MPEKEIVIVGGVADIQGSTQNTGSLTGENSLQGTIVGAAPETGQLQGVLFDATGSVGGQVVKSAGMTALNVTNGATGATLSLRPGIDGQDGKDGFSPTITVHEDTKTSYILKVTNKDGSYLTPNLYPDIEGLQDVEALVASKVDEDLAEYPVISPILLNTKQRNESYLYTRVLNVNRKIALSEVALEKETDEKIKRKLQTVNKVPEATQWKVGDYILLDHVPTDEE